MTDSPRVDRFMELLYRKDFFGRQHTRATVNAAFDEWAATLDGSNQPRPRINKYLKQATTPQRKEIKPMRTIYDDIREEHEMKLLLATVAAGKDKAPRQPSVNDGAVAAILKAIENPKDEWGHAVAPGHKDYRDLSAVVGTHSGEDFDRRDAHPMKGWSTLDACLYRKSLPSKFQQEQERLASIRAGMGTR